MKVPVTPEQATPAETPPEVAPPEATPPAPPEASPETTSPETAPETAPETTTPEATPSDGGAPATTSDQPAEGKVQFSVNVPADARVFVNGRLTRSTGATRHFVGHVSRVDRQYRVELRAELIRDGQTRVDTRVVWLQVGQPAAVRLDFATVTGSNLLNQYSLHTAGHLPRRGND